MKPEQISAVIEKFPFVRWVETAANGKNGEGWFLMEVSPLPPLEELPLVVSDIHHNRGIWVSPEGQVRHNPDCKENHHSIPNVLRRALPHLVPQTDKVAIHPGFSEAYGGQPLAFCVEPNLSYERCPSHPHLNAGGYHASLNRYLADSLCYTNDIQGLGQTDEDRMKQAIAYVVIWLFRHMVWEATKRERPEGVWPGASEHTFQPLDYLQILNPKGRCRCGSTKTYAQCHMSLDREYTETRTLVHLSEAQRKKVMTGVFAVVTNREQNRVMPQEKFIHELNRLFRGA